MRQSDHERPDVEAIMSRIHADAKEFLKSKPLPVRSYIPQQAKEGGESATPLLYSDSLNYLNAHWGNWASATEITSHRPFIGPIIVSVKKFFINCIWKYLLKGYFEQEREFHMKLVSHLNDTARYIDRRDAEIFWQLIEKIDNDIEGTQRQTEKLFDQITATLHTLQEHFNKKVDQLENDRSLLTEIAESSHNEILRLDALVRGLEGALVQLSETLTLENSTPFPGGTRSMNVIDAGRPMNALSSYLFQNRFGGSESEWKERVRDYLPFFEDAGGVILDLGCGRGEFLELLREAGKEGFGIDGSETMIRVCEGKNLSVTHMDPLSYLEQLGGQSLSGVFASRLLERLSAEKLQLLFSLIREKIKPGGKVVFEAINPQSVATLTRNFFRDPASLRPLHPETVEFLMSSNGIRVERMMMRSPFASQMMLQSIEVSDALPIRWKSTLLLLNENIKRLNDLLFGHQDYCIVGVVEERSARLLSPLNGEVYLAPGQTSYQLRDDVYDG